MLATLLDPAFLITGAIFAPTAIGMYLINRDNNAFMQAVGDRWNLLTNITSLQMQDPEANYVVRAHLIGLKNKVTLDAHRWAIFWNKNPRQLYHPDIQALWPAKETK